MRYYAERYDKVECRGGTLDELHRAILERCKRAGKSGLRLLPSDFTIVDTWDEDQMTDVIAARLVRCG